MLSESTKAEVYAIPYVIVAQAFVLLHEFGHIVLDQLKDDATLRVRVSENVEIDVYQTSRDQEFAADGFAVDRIVTSMRKAGHGLRDAALPIGMLLKYFEMRDICFGVDYSAPARTHPSPQQRWLRIMEAFGVTKDSSDAAAHLDQNLALLRDTLVNLTTGTA
jgi:hypothetical protein